MRDDRNAAIDGGGRDISRQIVPGNHVQDDVRSPAPRSRLRGRDEVLGLVVDGMVGTKRETRGALLGAARRYDHSGIERFGEHDGGGPDAARAAMDE